MSDGVIHDRDDTYRCPACGSLRYRSMTDAGYCPDVDCPYGRPYHEYLYSEAADAYLPASWTDV